MQQPTANAPKHGFTVTHPFHCATPIQMRFNDIDSLGHVNNMIYFSYFDMGRVDYFTRAGRQEFKMQHPPVMIANLNCNFLAQTHWGEPIEVLTQVDHLGTSSLVMYQHLVNRDTREVKCSCASVMVHLSPDDFTPAPITDEWRQLIADFEQRDM